MSCQKQTYILQQKELSNGNLAIQPRLYTGNLRQAMQTHNVLSTTRPISDVVETLKRVYDCKIHTKNNFMIVDSFIKKDFQQDYIAKWNANAARSISGIEEDAQ